MRLFRRRETLNDRLRRSAGLDEPRGEDARPPWDKAGIHGVQRPRDWEQVVTVEAAPTGDAATFVVLADAIVVEDGPDDVEPLAAAVTLEPPFRAEARRVDDRLWSVGARRIEVLELPGLAGEELELVSQGGFGNLNVDGTRVLGRFPQLEREGDYVIRGVRLDGDRWEVETALL